MQQATKTHLQHTKNDVDPIFKTIKKSIIKTWTCILHIFKTAKINNKNMDMHPIYFFKRLKSIIKNMNMHTMYGVIRIFSSTKIDNEKDFENNLNNCIVITFRNKYWL